MLYELVAKSLLKNHESNTDKKEGCDKLLCVQLRFQCRLHD